MRARRLPFNTRTRKSGHVKIELESEDHKMNALKQTWRLTNYKNLGHKVLVRGSQPYEQRQNIGNWRTYIHEQGLDNKFKLTKGGNLRPNTYQQQQQNQQSQMGQYQHVGQPMGQYQHVSQHMGQQTSQQPQIGQQMGQQMGQHQQVTQQMGQQTGNQQQTLLSSMQQQSQPMSQQNPTFASVAQPRPPSHVPVSSSVPFSSFTSSRPTMSAQVPNSSANLNLPNPGTLTNQFRFDFGNVGTQPPRAAAPGY